MTFRTSMATPGNAIRLSAILWIVEAAGCYGLGELTGLCWETGTSFRGGSAIWSRVHTYSTPVVVV
jgi:hypothetical protein